MTSSSRHGLGALLIAALLGGCGAKSALTVHRSGPDAGAARDAAPLADAGPRPCRLSASEALVVHEDTLGPFDEPAVVVRADGTIDLVARRVGDRRETSEVRARRARVGTDGSVTFVGASTSLFGPSIGFRAGALGTQLATCSTLGGPTDLTEVRTWDADYIEAGRSMPLAALGCHAIVGRGDRALFVTRGIAEGSVVLERRADGRMVRGPDEAFEPAVGANVSAASIDDGFAWVGVLDVDGRTQVVFRDDAGGEAREDFFIARRAGGAKPVIGPGLGPGSATVAHYDAEELFVSIITPGRGEVARSIALAFSTRPDLDPSVVRLEGNLLALSLDYGDADPTRGALNASALSSTLEVTDRLARETTRDASRRFGGISAAVVGDRAVVHWAEGAPGSARTMVMTLTCR